MTVVEVSRSVLFFELSLCSTFPTAVCVAVQSSAARQHGWRGHRRQRHRGMGDGGMGGGDKAA